MWPIFIHESNKILPQFLGKNSYCITIRERKLLQSRAKLIIPQFPFLLSVCCRNQVSSDNVTLTSAYNTLSNIFSNPQLSFCWYMQHSRYYYYHCCLTSNKKTWYNLPGNLDFLTLNKISWSLLYCKSEYLILLISVLLL